MALYKVKKVPLKDLSKNKQLEIGDVIERNVKDVEQFEKKFGKEYLERVEEAPKKKKQVSK